MWKKIILTYLFPAIIICTSSQASWLSSAASALKSAGASVVNTVGDAASGAVHAVENVAGAAASVGLGASAQLSYCRQIASVPGGVNTAEYQAQCGNMAFVCQQLRMTNPQVAVDPYCATVSGMGQMMGPWGGATSTFMPGINTAATPANTDPNKVGWSTPAPPPYGFTMGMGAYGVSPMNASGVGALLATSVISRLFGSSSGPGGMYGGGFGGGGYGGGGMYGQPSAGGPTTYSADYLDE
jgi:hypothetical protein